MEPQFQTHELHELLQMLPALKKILAADLEKRVSALECPEVVNKRSERPTIEMVQLYGAKIGLPPDQAEWFFNFYQSNGWKVGRNPMKSWQSAMINWRKNWQTKGLGVGTATNGTYRLKLIIDAKQQLLNQIRNQYSSETANGRVWMPTATQEVRKHAHTLCSEIKQLTAQLAQSA